MRKVYWVGEIPKTCEVSRTTITGVFVDGKLKGGYSGAWALMHPDVHAKIGVGLGQCYERQPDGRWLKTAG